MNVPMIPEPLLGSLTRLGCKANGDSIRLPTGRFAMWPIGAPTDEAQPDLLGLASRIVSSVAAHSQGVHKIKNDTELSQEGKARRHRLATPPYVEQIAGAAVALVRLERQHGAAVAMFYNVEPGLPGTVVLALLDAESRSWIGSADASALSEILVAVTKGTQSEAQRRLVYAWKAAGFPLRPEFADQLREAWDALRRVEAPEQATALDARGDALTWARVVVHAACRAFVEDSGIQPVELHDLLAVPAFDDAIALFWSTEQARQLAGMSSAGVVAAA